MYESLIKSYIESLSVFDVLELAKKRQIDLSEEEAKVLLDMAKKHFMVFYKGDPTELLLELKEKLTPDHFAKLKEIYIEAKNKWT